MSLRFEEPPVRIAMLILWFRSIRDLRTLDLAPLRVKWLDILPRVHEMYPLPSWAEDEDDVRIVDEDAPWPMPACVFLSLDEDREVLVQNDRLIVTWRFGEDRSPYPGFPTLLDYTRDAYSDFVEALRVVGYEAPAIAKVGIRYNNIIQGVDHQDAATAVMMGTQIERSDSARAVDSVRIGKHFCATDANRNVTIYVAVSEGAEAAEDDHGHQSKATQMALDGDAEVPSGTDPMARLVEVHDSTIEQFVSLIGPDLRKSWGENSEG